MGTMLKCPLCCGKEFDSPSSLKYHILSVADNLLCPECDGRFHDLIELAEHVGEGCGVRFVPEENDDEQLEDEQQQDVETVAQPHTEDHEIEYFCQVCNIYFPSVEEHVAQYHQGEEVLLEIDERMEYKSNLQNEVQAASSGAEEDSTVFALDQNEEMIKEESCIDKDGMPYTRKVVKIDQFWLDDAEGVEPIIEKYISEKGLVRKLTEEEEKTMQDTNSIILVHQCPKCYLQFPRADHFAKHICNPLQIKQKFKCTHCTMVYESLAELNTHMASHLQEEDGTVKRVIMMGPHTCTTCNTMYPSYRSLRQHQKVHKPVEDDSPESSVNYTILGPKDGNGIIRGMFICTICNNTYDKEYEEVHMKSHEEYTCNICNEKFYSKENLKLHVNAHVKSETFSCNNCKMTYSSYEAIKEHMRTNCQKRTYACQFCDRWFARPYEKEKHERIHTGEKPHVCDVCGKAFRVSYCLTLHLRTHSSTRPYVCSYCPKRFKSHSVFKHHLRTHSDDRAYRCPHCPKTFKTLVHLAGHKNVHLKPFTCMQCNRPFSSLYALKAHVALHEKANNLKFDCLLCGASYAKEYALREHLKQQHSIDATQLDDGVLVEVEDEETADEATGALESDEQEDDEQEAQGQNAT